MILIYTHKVTSRVHYVFNLVFSELLKTDFEVTDDPNRISGHDGPVINYSKDEVPGSLQFAPYGLLHEQGVREQAIDHFSWEDLSVFFGVEGKSKWPFDPFSQIFFIVSRYEEYLQFSPDQHGRFSSSLSILDELDLLHKPVVNLLGFRLRNLVEQEFPGFKFSKPEFRFIPTFDIDITFAHKGKGIVRGILAAGKLLLKGKLSELNDRLAVLLGRKHDPYDNFDFQLDTVAGLKERPIYFALVGDFGKYDRNISHTSKSYQKVLKRLPSVHLHHSYRSFSQPERIAMERKRIERITQKNITWARAHFLRFCIPETYVHLISSGISDDYSMGYSDTFGFRAGIAVPHFHYNLITEQQTSLRVHPFCFMDTAFPDHLEMEPDEAFQKVLEMKNILEKTGGEMIGIWHNYALGETQEYQGWQEFFVKTIALMKR